MAKVHFASSWWNHYYPQVVDVLRSAGHEVFDFRHPWAGYEAFRWSDISPDWESWSIAEYRNGLKHPVSKEKFRHDLEAMQWADICVLVLPCGRSALLEAGWFTGAGKQMVAFIPEKQEPERMYNLFDDIAVTTEELVTILKD